MMRFRVGSFYLWSGKRFLCLRIWREGRVARLKRCKTGETFIFTSERVVTVVDKSTIKEIK